MITGRQLISGFIDIKKDLLSSSFKVRGWVHLEQGSIIPPFNKG